MPFSVNRRRLMQGAGATLGALSLRGFVVAQSEAVYFTHGVASGDPWQIGLFCGLGYCQALAIRTY